MTDAPLLNAPPPWESFRSHVLLWHGCLRPAATAIRRDGVDPSRCRPDTDFGRGFYTTTARRQAQHWAWKQSEALDGALRRGRTPVTLRFRVPLAELSALNGLHFVLGDLGNDRLWSFIHHCRQSRPGAVRDHLHPDPAHDGWYDVISGPVAAFWDQCVAMIGADQISFHTPAAAEVLNRLIRSGDRAAFAILPVRRPPTPE